MKLFATALASAALIMLLPATALQAQMFVTTGDTVVKEDSVVIPLSRSSENKLFETPGHWVTVACGQSRDLQISVDQGYVDAQVTMDMIIIALVNDSSLVERVPGVSAWQFSSQVRSIVVGMTAVVSEAIGQRTTAQGDVYTTCVAVAADKRLLSFDYVRKHATLDTVR